MVCVCNGNVCEIGSGVYNREYCVYVMEMYVEWKCVCNKECCVE